MGSPGNICTICGANYRADALFCPQDGAPLGSAAPKANDPMVGAELPGRIRIERLIGVGAMGRVYRGFQRGVDRAVAVKILHSELSTDKTMVARFHREAKVASLLAHPNVVEVVMTGEVPAGSPGAGSLYIVMEYVDGISLRSALAAAEGAIQLARALRIVLQLCEAVGEAHARGIVHRDLKPENVMLVRRAVDPDFVKVLDFGMARVPAGSGPVLTRAGLIFGTARYISPEGAAGEPVGPAADVYAIATILYQALAGRTPFEGDSAVQVLASQINDRPPPLQSHARAAYVPDAIARAIETNLAKHPSERNRDARALAKTLLDAARAAGLAPETLLARSPLLGEPFHEQAFHSAEARPPSVGPGDSPDDIAYGDRPSVVARATSTQRTLMFLVGCVAGGAALAAVGAGLRAEGPSKGARDQEGAPRDRTANGGDAGTADGTTRP